MPKPNSQTAQPRRDVLSVRGARVHNLKNLSLEIPHNTLTVVTGVSGSGKSSLVFDTIYAEGQRRYVESLSAYARQFLERMEKPAVDSIDGIAPPIAVKQKNQTRNPRSTVGTTTEIHDYLRLLFARIGRTYCPKDGELVRRDDVDSVAQRVLALPSGSRFLVLFPAFQRKVDLSPEALRMQLFELRKKGYNRLFQDGRVFEFSTPESLLDIDFSRPLYLVADRLSVDSSQRQRLVDAIEACYREAGESVFRSAAGDLELRFNENFQCKTCLTAYEEPSPLLFSFNSPAGACPRCQGFGSTIDYDPNLVIPDPTMSLMEGAVEPWTKPAYEFGWHRFVKSTRDRVRLDVPVLELSREERLLLDRAVRSFFEAVEQKKYKMHVRVFLAKYRGYATCPDCEGSRLRPEALSVRVGGLHMGDLCRLSITEAKRFFDTLQLTPEEQTVADKVLREVRERLSFLENVGLEYLTLDRKSATLSGGEAQRITLATCLGSRLAGAIYVLDEPSIGLHSRDTTRLIQIMKNLRDLGNTILVVEHDADVMKAADHVVDLGPGAGELGGQLQFEGTLEQLIEARPGTLTSRYLRGDAVATRQEPRRKKRLGRALKFLGCFANNLTGFDVEIPLDMMVAVTGVSGSGKSSLVHEVIYRALKHKVTKNAARDSAESTETERAGCRKVEGLGNLRELVMVDQSPIGRTPRSNPVTYLKAFDLIRELLSGEPEAVRRGYGPGHFSFNIPGGRCDVCEGDGTVTVEMQFLADVELICEECRGSRFKSSTLEIRHRGLNVDDILKLSVDEALVFFVEHGKLRNKLKVLSDIGLGYLRLGQSATTLSGGEAQRVKLAAHLSASSVSDTLFLLDEPTTGLHFDDIAKLLRAFDKLVDNGASILVIEHNLDVIQSADWVIDLGPEGGSGGGRIVAQGPPERIAQVAGSHTGVYLAREMARLTESK